MSIRAASPEVLAELADLRAQAIELVRQIDRLTGESPDRPRRGRPASLTDLQADFVRGLVRACEAEGQSRKFALHLAADLQCTTVSTARRVVEMSGAYRRPISEPQLRTTARVKSAMLATLRD